MACRHRNRRLLRCLTAAVSSFIPLRAAAAAEADLFHLLDNNTDVPTLSQYGGVGLLDTRTARYAARRLSGGDGIDQESGRPDRLHVPGLPLARNDLSLVEQLRHPPGAGGGPGRGPQFRCQGSPGAGEHLCSRTRHRPAGLPRNRDLWRRVHRRLEALRTVRCLARPRLGAAGVARHVQESADLDLGRLRDALGRLRSRRQTDPRLFPGAGHGNFRGRRVSAAHPQSENSAGIQQRCVQAGAAGEREGLRVPGQCRAELPALGGGGFRAVADAREGGRGPAFAVHRSRGRHLGQPDRSPARRSGRAKKRRHASAGPPCDLQRTPQPPAAPPPQPPARGRQPRADEAGPRRPIADRPWTDGRGKPGERSGSSTSAYLRDAEAVSRAARALSASAPPNIEEFHIVTIANGIAVGNIVIDRDALEKLGNQDSSPAELLRSSELAPPPASIAEFSDPNYRRFIWNIHPFMRQSVFDPDNPFFVGLGIGADASVEIGRGWWLGASASIMIFDTFSDIDRESDSVLPHVRSDVAHYLKEGRYGFDSLQSSYYFKLGREVYGRATAGYLEEMFAGVGRRGALSAVPAALGHRSQSLGGSAARLRAPVRAPRLPDDHRPRDVLL